MVMVPVASSGAYQMLGRVLATGWTVTHRVGWREVEMPDGTRMAIKEDGTGANFSVGYRASHPQKGEGFIKAVDLGRVNRSPNIMEAFKRLMDDFSFEQAVLKICADRHLDRVVYAIDTGEENISDNLQDKVPYFVFAMAEGDVRRRLRTVAQSAFSAWACRALHHAAVGLRQLHTNDMAHQDMKPSNLLDFGASGIFKVADVGRAARKGVDIRHCDIPVAGDPSYAPPELLYGSLSGDWNVRRLACDAYLLGSMICFFYLGECMTRLIMQRLDPMHRPTSWHGQWQGSFDDVVPYWRTAMTAVLEDLEEVVPEAAKELMVVACRQLCDPDPANRGHPLERKRSGGNPYTLDRYISAFNLAAEKAAILARAAA